MTQFLEITVTLMTCVSMCLVASASLIQPLRRSKVFNYICSMSAFATASIFGVLLAFDGSAFAAIGVILWSLVGSMKFAHTAWPTS